MISQESADPADDRPELMVTERPDQDAAGVVTVLLAPRPQQGSEVTGIAGDEDTVLLGRELQHLRIVECAECRVGREAENVVAIFLER